MKKILLPALLLYSLLSCQKQQMLPTVKQLPRFNLLTDTLISKDKKQPVTLIIKDTVAEANYAGKIERRGGFSIIYPKHSYEMDLKVDIALGGLPADDDWILNANYIDKTFLRHVFAYDLFRAMHPNNRAAQTQFVELALNNQYQGLYVLMEKLDKSSLQIDGKDPAAVIFKEPPLFRLDAFSPQDPDNYHQQTYPKIKKTDKRAFIENIRRFLEESEESVFSKEIATIFDMSNIIDWHLLLLLTNNNDGILKNFYLYKVDAATPLRIAPWDYDHSLGRDGDNELNLIKRTLKVERSLLFKRLLALDWYKKSLRERWLNLNQRALFSVGGLNQRIDQCARQIAPFVDKNFTRWPVDTDFYYDGNTHLEELAIIKKYITMRHQQLTEYFGQL
ncbi:MAG: CotH kinase family protein [Bacteroidota bacterium]